MAETASCAGRGTGLASSTCQPPRSSVPRQPASRPAMPSQCGSNHSGPWGRRAVRSRSTISPLVFPSPRLGCSAAITLGRRRTLGFDARASVTAWLIGAGLEALDPDRRQNVIEGWNAYRDHGPRLVGDGGCDVRLGRGGVGARERAALLEWLPLTDRELAVYEGGLFEDAPTHAIALLVRPPTIWAFDEAIERRAAVPAWNALRARAVRRDRAPCVRADPRRAPRPAPPVGRQNRGPVAGGRAPGCERDHRLRLRARR